MNNDRKSLCTEYENQTSPELEEILRTELEKDQPDRQTVLQILDILETRDSGTSAENELPTHARHERKATGRWLRTAAAAVVIVLVFAFAAPPVFGAENIVELVGRWTQDLFALFRSDSPNQLQTEYVYKTSNPDLQKIYDAAVEHGITQKVVPTWIPEECALQKLESRVTPQGTNLCAYFSGNDHYLIFSFGSVTDISFEKYPKDEEDARVYEKDGKTHYILPNNDAWTAVWASGDIGGSIITDYSEDTVRSILKSIYSEGK